MKKLIKDFVAWLEAWADRGWIEHCPDPGHNAFTKEHYGRLGMNAYARWVPGAAGRAGNYRENEPGPEGPAGDYREGKPGPEGPRGDRWTPPALYGMTGERGYEGERGTDFTQVPGAVPAESANKRIAHKLEDGSYIFGGIYQTKAESAGLEGLKGTPGEQLEKWEKSKGDPGVQGLRGEPMPLRFLHRYKEDCVKVFRALMVEGHYQLHRVVPNPNMTVLLGHKEGLAITVMVWFDGRITLQPEQNPIEIDIFRAVKVIKELGYYPER